MPSNSPNLIIPELRLQTLFDPQLGEKIKNEAESFWCNSEHVVKSWEDIGPATVSDTGVYYLTGITTKEEGPFAQSVFRILYFPTRELRDRYNQSNPQSKHIYKRLCKNNLAKVTIDRQTLVKNSEKTIAPCFERNVFSCAKELAQESEQDHSSSCSRRARKLRKHKARKSTLPSMPVALEKSEENSTEKHKAQKSKLPLMPVALEKSEDNSTEKHEAQKSKLPSMPVALEKSEDKNLEAQKSKASLPKSGSILYVTDLLDPELSKKIQDRAVAMTDKSLVYVSKVEGAQLVLVYYPTGLEVIDPISNEKVYQIHYFSSANNRERYHRLNPDSKKVYERLCELGLTTIRVGGFSQTFSDFALEKLEDKST